MPKLTIVVGMAGSGKTYLCNQIAHKSNPKAKVFADATLTNTDERRAGHDCLGEIVARLIGRGQNCVIDEPHLVVSTFRESFKQFCDEFLPQVPQEWIFFQPDVLACINNVYNDAKQNGRDELSRYEALNNQRKVYVLPDVNNWPGGSAESVNQYSKPHFRTVEEAVNWLESKIRDKM